MIATQIHPKRVRNTTMAWNDFVPQMQGRDLPVATIDGPHGAFQIAFAGINRDDGTSYFYQDERVRFGFLVEKHLTGGLCIDVKWATTGGVESGLAFKTSKDNEEILCHNIELFFKTRHWIRPWLPRDANSATVTVIFSWNIVQ
jgi:hypothetical protein